MTTMTYYTTKQGDTWDTIAFEQYGSELKAQNLMQERKNITLLDYEVFPAGVVVAIPDIEEESKYSDSLPAWRLDDEEDEW